MPLNLVGEQLNWPQAMPRPTLNGVQAVLALDHLDPPRFRNDRVTAQPLGAAFGAVPTDDLSLELRGTNSGLVIAHR